MNTAYPWCQYAPCALLQPLHGTGIIQQQLGQFWAFLSQTQVFYPAEGFEFHFTPCVKLYVNVQIILPFPATLDRAHRALEPVLPLFPSSLGKFFGRTAPPRILLPKGCKCTTLTDFQGCVLLLYVKQQLLLRSISRWNSNLLTLRYECEEKRVLGLARTHLTLLPFTFLLVPQIKYLHVSRRCIKFLLFAVGVDQISWL